MDLSFLSAAGVSAGEIKVCQAILDHGSSSVNKIHEHTGIERRNVYDIINKLLDKGLISYVLENKCKVFRLVHPSKFLEFINEKQEKLAKAEAKAKELLPEIILQQSLLIPEVNASVFRGLEGLKSIWQDMLNYEQALWIGSGRYVLKSFPHYFAQWNKEREKRKISWLNIMRNELKKETVPLKYEKRKFLPKEFSVNPAAIVVYGNKVVHFLFGKQVFSFMIESKEIAENYKQYHSYLWKHVAKK